jgi:hypothetical protein
MFVAPPEQVRELLIDLRHYIPSQNTVLVTRNPQLRPVIRWLVAAEYPYLKVLTEEELLAQYAPEEGSGAGDMGQPQGDNT